MKGIHVSHVTKRYKDAAALEDVSVTFEEGKIYGLLGRNGAGKSTLLNIITNRIFADSGEVTVDEVPARENDEAQRKIYLMSEGNCYPKKMRIEEVFHWTSQFYPEFDLECAKTLSERFELSVRKRVKSLSTGYNSVFKVITALSANVPYLLLDEPVLGLDANHRALFYRVLLERYTKKPFMAVLSTHLIEEVSNVIEDIVIIKKGQILRSESRESLLSKGYTVTGARGAVDAYIADKNVIGSDKAGGLKSAYIMEERNQEIVPEGLEVSELNLQSLFIQLTNS